MEGWLDGWLNKRFDVQMVRWINDCTNGGMERGMDG